MVSHGGFLGNYLQIVGFRDLCWFAGGFLYPFRVEMDGISWSMMGFTLKHGDEWD